MNTIAKLEEKIASVEGDIQTMAERAASVPGDFSLSLTLESLKRHCEDLQQQLREEKLRREYEIIELRLKGKSVKSGSVPLHILGELSRHWSDALIAGANHIKMGQKAKKKASKDIIDTLDLRLAAIGPGSTRLIITGNNAPDLFGNSLLENTLQESFALLSSSTGDMLADKVSRLGKRTAESFDRFLKTMTLNELEIEATWSSPSEASYQWSGDTERMLQLSHSLESLVESEPEELQFKGQLVTISMKGTFEIADDTEVTYKGTYPTEMLEHMKEYHIGQDCTGVLIRRKMINRVSGYEKSYYVLKNIK